jgi:hypothetical protein
MILIIGGVVVGMHLFSLANYLATPDPLEQAKRQSREIFKSMGKDLPKDFEQQFAQDLDKLMDTKEVQSALRRNKMISLLWMLGSFSLSAVLLTFLYLRHDWARVVLGVLCLIGAGLGLLGIVFGGLAALRFLSVGAAILGVLEMLVRLGVYLGIGLALMKSESIAAYTSGR